MKLFKKKKKKQQFQDLTETVNQTVQQSIDPTAQRFLTDFLGGAKGMLSAAQDPASLQFLPLAADAISAITSPGYAQGSQFLPFANDALSALTSPDFASNTPYLNSGADTLQAFLNPNFLNERTPGIDSLLNIVGDRAARAVSDRFSLAGRSGSPAAASSIARGVSEATAPILFNDLNARRAQQLQALSFLPGFENVTNQRQQLQNQALSFLPGLESAANQRQQIQNQVLSFLPGFESVGLSAQQLPLQNFGLAAAPFLQAASLLPSGQSTSGTNTSQGVGGGYNTLGGQILGGITTALPILGSLFSDRDLKRDIRKIGEIADGVGLYMFKYIWDARDRIGVMADEIPEEFVTEKSGFKAVDYEALAFA